MMWLKPVFHFNRIVAERSVRISLFREHSGRTNDMDIIEYGTFRYDTVEVENDLNDGKSIVPFKFLQIKCILTPT